MNDLDTLRKHYSNDQTASFYTDQFFSSIAENKDAELRFSEIVVSTLERYKNIREIKEKVATPGDLNQLLASVLRIFPSFGFIICNELDKLPGAYDYTKLLRISTAASCIARKVDYQVNASLFLQEFEATEKPDQVNEVLSQKLQDISSLPGAFQDDLLNVAKDHPPLKTTTNPHELIEVIYYFKAIKQIFLKYYFYLIGLAQNDTIAVYINRMFSRLLLTVRRQEMQFWNTFKNGNQLQSQLNAGISKDSEKSRHPQLRKHIFEGINKFNPVFQDGSLNSTVIEVRQLLAKQLAIFNEMSINKLVLMLDLTQKTEGSGYVTYLLIQLSSTNIEKLFNFRVYLENLATDKTKALLKLVTSYSSKLPGADKRLRDARKEDKNSMTVVYKTADTLRSSHAKQRLKETEGKRGMTYDQVADFLEERLKKLYQKAKKEGALTQDKIPEYLAQFAAVAEEMIGTIPAEKRKAAIDEFKTTTNDILENISSEGHLTEEQVEGYRANIQEKAQSLDTEDIEKRTDAVDEIGVTLTEASFTSDKQKEKDDLSEFLSKNLIPYGFEKKAKRISVAEFFKFPFGDYSGPDEENWFDFHLKYLQMAVKENKMEKSNFIKIYNSVPQLPKIKYKKYFNIFPNEQFEETTFMAVYDLWVNKAFDRLKAE